MNLSDLIARVEKLEGPDKDVNRAIDRELTRGAMFFADFTGSLDASLALVERLGLDVKTCLLAAIASMEVFSLQRLPLAVCHFALRAVEARDAD